MKLQVELNFLCGYIITQFVEDDINSILNLFIENMSFGSKKKYSSYF